MKIVFRQNIDASDVIQESIDLGSTDERAVASLINAEGRNTVEAWFVAETDFSSTMTIVRNTALLEANYDRIAVSGSTTQAHEIVDASGHKALRTGRYRYDFSRQGATDWTVAAVIQLGNVADAANTSVFGWAPGATGTNQPSLNITGTGSIRSFMSANQTTGVISVAGAIPNIKTQPYLIVISQSRTRGAFCRVNGVTVYSNAFANGKAPSTGTSVSFLGSDVLSAAFDGLMFETILCNEDITADEYKLRAVEGYLMRKFGL